MRLRPRATLACLGLVASASAITEFVALAPGYPTTTYLNLDRRIGVNPNPVNETAFQWMRLDWPENASHASDVDVRIAPDDADTHDAIGQWLDYDPDGLQLSAKISLDGSKLVTLEKCQEYTASSARQEQRLRRRTRQRRRRRHRRHSRPRRCR